VLCLQLHGRLQVEEQRKVFEECGEQRKVVFATNCAETSITVPGKKAVSTIDFSSITCWVACVESANLAFLSNKIQS
jgi:5-deoxy-D-glucuronate isomerase